MIHTFKIALLIMLNLALVFSSCTIEKRVHRKGYHVTSNLGNKKWMKKASKKSNVEQQQKQTTDKIMMNKMPLIKAPVLASASEQPEFIEQTKIEQMESEIKMNEVESSSQKKKVNPKKRIQKRATKKVKTEKEKTDTTKMTTRRKIALTNGISLILMAILAGIAMPALGTAVASVGLIGIFLLDVLVSWSMWKYHKKERPKLSKVTSVLRLIYTAILGVAVGQHLAGNVAAFNHIWGIGLIAFGVHLIFLGIMYNNEGGKKWVNVLIKSLLITAGIGYLIQYIGILVVAGPVAFAAMIEPIFIVPMVLGEMLYALWMIIKGGKSTDS